MGRRSNTSAGPSIDGPSFEYERQPLFKKSLTPAYNDDVTATSGDSVTPPGEHGMPGEAISGKEAYETAEERPVAEEPNPERSVRAASGPSTQHDSQKPRLELIALWATADWKDLQATSEGKEAWAAIERASPPDLQTEMTKLGYLIPFRAGSLLRLWAVKPRALGESLKYMAELRELIRTHLPDIRWCVVHWNDQSYVVVEPTLEAPKQKVKVPDEPEMVKP